MVFTQDGTCLFSGGVTVSRGHEGSSVGGEQVLAVLNGESVEQSVAPPVFGCRLCLPLPTSRRGEKPGLEVKQQEGVVRENGLPARVVAEGTVS